MRTTPDGKVIIAEIEKQTILEGLRLFSAYCECELECIECPFFKTSWTTDESMEIHTCDIKDSLPCFWTIPTEWKKEERND